MVSQNEVLSSPSRTKLLTVAFSLPVFLSAGLLFWVQPLIAKMLLPLLGGAPAVWNTCMVFFQAMLLAGYAYALVITQALKLRQQVALHLIILIATGLLLPFGISARVVESIPRENSPIIWLLVSLFVIVGPPFFVLAASGPLLQKWFSKTNHPDASNPYFLYSLSNAGSFISLLAFPFFLEPMFAAKTQSRAWSFGYVVLGLSFAVIGFLLWKVRAASSTAESLPVQTVAVPISARYKWLLLAFLPSSLMLGVTTYISTDIASVPLIWILPLALYLSTFVLAFSGKQFFSLRFLSFVIPTLLVALALAAVTEADVPRWLIIIVHLALFFFAALLCHTLLSNARPGVDRLPEFYLWLAVGGVLGGVFNALIAPVVFSSTLEYPLILIAVTAVRTLAHNSGREKLLDTWIPAAAAALAIVGLVVVPQFRIGQTREALVIIGLPLLFAYLVSSKKPLVFAASLLLLLACARLYTSTHESTIYQTRNFFGTWRIVEIKGEKQRRVLHGTTIHGIQFTDERQCQPTSYFHNDGPLGDVFRAYNAQPSTNRVAVTGLASGTIAAHSRSDQTWDFYEIDPAAVAIARDTGHFSYVKGCASGTLNMIVGDARLRLQEAQNSSYGLIVLDAFASDSVPTHLVTREALSLYLAKLAPGGLLAFNISNRYFDFKPLFAGLARDAGLVARVATDNSYNRETGKFPSIWLVLARTSDDLKNLDHQGQRWQTPQGDVVWTDDFSNIFTLMKWNVRQGS